MPDASLFAGFNVMSNRTLTSMVTITVGIYTGFYCDWSKYKPGYNCGYLATAMS